MKKLLIATIATSTLLMAGSAFAAPSASATTGVVTITGAVAAKCNIAPTGSIDLSATDLALAADGTLNAAAVNGKSTTLSAWCNGTNSTMTVKAESLVGDHTTTDTAFTNIITFTATATAYHGTAATGTAIGSGTADSDSTDTATSTAQTVGVFSGDIKVALSGAATANATDILVAGTYTGYARVTLTPTL